MKLKKLVKELNIAEIMQRQCSDEWYLDFEEVFKKLNISYADFKLVDKGVDVDKHRWYETSMRIYSVLGGLMGVELVTQLYSEENEYYNIGHRVKFYETEEEKTITYTKVIVVEGKNK